MQTIQNTLILFGAICIPLVLFFGLHALPAWRHKNATLEYLGWTGGIIASIYLLMPSESKLVNPNVPFLGIFAEVAALACQWFCIATGAYGRAERFKSLELPIEAIA